MGGAELLIYAVEHVVDLFLPFMTSNPCLPPLHCVGFSCAKYILWPVSTWWVYPCSITCQKFAKRRSWIEANIWRNSLGVRVSIQKQQNDHDLHERCSMRWLMLLTLAWTLLFAYTIARKFVKAKGFMKFTRVFSPKGQKSKPFGTRVSIGHAHLVATGCARTSKAS
jgi:hypothetical protein